MICTNLYAGDGAISVSVRRLPPPSIGELRESRAVLEVYDRPGSSSSVAVVGTTEQLAAIAAAITDYLAMEGQERSPAVERQLLPEDHEE